MCYSPNNKHSLETKKANTMLSMLYHNMLPVFTAMILCVLWVVFYWLWAQLYFQKENLWVAFYMTLKTTSKHYKAICVVFFIAKW